MTAVPRGHRGPIAFEDPEPFFTPNRPPPGSSSGVAPAPVDMETLIRNGNEEAGIDVETRAGPWGYDPQNNGYYAEYQEPPEIGQEVSAIERAPPIQTQDISAGSNEESTILVNPGHPRQKARFVQPPLVAPQVSPITDDGESVPTVQGRKSVTFQSIAGRTYVVDDDAPPTAPVANTKQVKTPAMTSTPLVQPQATGQAPKPQVRTPQPIASQSALTLPMVGSGGSGRLLFPLPRMYTPTASTAGAVHTHHDHAHMHHHSHARQTPGSSAAHSLPTQSAQTRPGVHTQAARDTATSAGVSGANADPLTQKNLAARRAAIAARMAASAHATAEDDGAAPTAATSSGRAPASSHAGQDTPSSEQTGQAQAQATHRRTHSVSTQATGTTTLDPKNKSRPEAVPRQPPPIADEESGRTDSMDTSNVSVQQPRRPVRSFTAE